MALHVPERGSLVEGPCGDSGLGSPDAAEMDAQGPLWGWAYRVAMTLHEMSDNETTESQF